MASRSTQPGAADNKSILTPVMTLEGHEPWKYSWSIDEDPEHKDVSSISYSPDGKQMISGSKDKTVRRWDLRVGKEIEEARVVCEDGIETVGVSRDGRWVVTAGRKSLKVCEVETGIVRTFGEGNWINCIDISADSTLLAGGSYWTARIWNLDTGELVAGPFECYVGALQFSEDSRKLAVMSVWGRCLQVWDVQAQKLDVQRKSTHNVVTTSPVIWTTKHKSILAAFSFIADDFPTVIYEFDASTLKTVGAPFKGHTDFIRGLALSSDCVLLVSSSYDNTIKLWAFESRQLLASFDVETTICLVLSPDSRQLAYTTWNETKICICDIPVDILASIGLAKEPQPSTNKSKRSCNACLLNSDATRRPVSRKPVITPVMSAIPRPLPTRDPHTFLSFLRKLLPSSHTNAVRPIDADELHNPLDFPATHALPRPLVKPEENSRPTPAPPTTQSSAIDTPATLKSSLHRISTWWPFQTDHASLAIVNVPLAPAKLRYATAGAPGHDDSVIRDEDYVSPAPSLNSGQHGNSRFCFCF